MTCPALSFEGELCSFQSLSSSGRTEEYKVVFLQLDGGRFWRFCAALTYINYPVLTYINFSPGLLTDTYVLYKASYHHRDVLGQLRHIQPPMYTHPKQAML